MEKRFNKKVAVITGAGDGMGRQFALDLAREGAAVVVTDIDRDAVDRVVAEIEHAGGRALGSACDVSSRAQIDTAIAQTVSEYGSVDILINNAGLLVPGTIEETSDELIDRTLDINVKGILYAIRRVTPLMKAKRYGRIVNIASITGKRGDNSTVFVYGASKGAVISLTRSAARELGPFGITCNAVAPHAIMTRMMRYWDDAKKESAAAQIPVRRLGTTQDVSRLVLFLASDESSFITGETVNINGGYYMD
ncbi:MAG: SDR family oxidoreductase [Spirochaetaceae bacterium]|nr:MAG: SDR family oxidoreductase [Spirochaetaceae bacterium]